MTKPLNEYIDHTLLRADATEKEFEQLCREAREFRFASVCVPPTRIKLARDVLSSSTVRICSVVGFPLGSTLTEVKAFEARKLAELGAHEIDMVMNIGALKDGHELLIQEDIEAVLKAATPCPVKVIIETSLLSPSEKTKAAEIIVKAGALFIKTSTGFGEAGASVSDIELIQNAVGKLIQIKASGGIRDLETAEALIAAGASRLGCSRSVEIMKEWQNRSSS